MGLTRVEDGEGAGDVLGGPDCERLEEVLEGGDSVGDLLAAVRGRDERLKI